MSRALSVLEEFTPSSSINREALMLDEGKVFNQWWKEDDAGGGDILPVGTLIQDGSGNVWERTGTQGLKMISGSAPGAQFRTIASVVERFGSFFMTQTGRGIDLSPTGSFRRLTQDETGNLFPSGGTGGDTYHPPAWRPGELELEQEALAQRLQELQMGFDNDTAQATAAHTRAIELLEMELASASELQKERIQAEIDLENMRHENDLEELGIRLEAERKNIIYGEVGATKRTLIQEQGATGRELLGLGADPFAQAAGMKGQATRGVTPQAQAIGQANAFINQPLPQVNFDMPLPQMEAVLAGMQGIQAPSAGGFGMGGTIGMAGGGSVKSKKPQSVIVGEAGKEIVTGSDFQVTPLTGTAQFGARIGGMGTTFGSPFYRSPMTAEGPDWASPSSPSLPDIPNAPDPSGDFRSIWPQQPMTQPLPLVQSILQNLAQSGMYTGSPFGQVPTAQGYGGDRLREPNAPIGVGGQWGPLPTGLSPLDALSALGTAPQIIRPPSGNTYYIQDGMRHWIPGGGSSNVLTSLGLNPAQVVNVTHEDALRFPPGEWFTGTGSQAAGAVSGQTGYGALGVPLIEPTSGALLMSPHKIAANWHQMMPGEQQNILSAYAAAGGATSQTGFGLGKQNVLDMIQTFTPAGRGYGRRIGGMGAQF